MSFSANFRFHLSSASQLSIQARTWIEFYHIFSFLLCIHKTLNLFLCFFLSICIVRAKQWMKLQVSINIFKKILFGMKGSPSCSPGRGWTGKQKEAVVWCACRFSGAFDGQKGYSKRCTAKREILSPISWSFSFFSFPIESFVLDSRHLFSYLSVFFLIMNFRFFAYLQPMKWRMRFDPKCRLSTP